MEFREQYELLESKFNPTNAPSLQKLVNFNSNASEPIHRWYYFKEGFSHKLVENAIDEFYKPDKKGLIFDPFCGSGTTLVTSQLKKINSIGTEVNPFLAFVSRTKITNHIRAKKLEQVLENVLGYKTQRTFKIPELTTFKRAFTKKKLQKLLALNYAISKIKDKKNQALLKLALASIIEDSSKIRRYGKGLRFKDKPENNDPDELFREKCELMIEDIKNNQNRILATVKKQDARKLDVPGDKIDFVLFSPPYLNTFDYNEVYKLELWLMGYVNNYSQFSELSKQNLRSHLAGKYDNLPFDQLAVKDLVQKLDLKKKELWNVRIPKMINSYFTDMNQVFVNLSQILKPGTPVAFVVGNSSYGGLPIATDLILSDIAQKNGFEVGEIRIARKLTTSSQQLKNYREEDKKYLRESMVVLRKK